MPLVEQKLLTLQDNLSTLLVFSELGFGYSILVLSFLCNVLSTIVCPSGAPEFTPGFYWGLCYSIFSFICMFCGSLFVLLYFFFWPLCCLFFFDLRILIASFASSCLFVIYLLAIVLLVLLRFTVLVTPLNSSTFELFKRFIGLWRSKRRDKKNLIDNIRTLSENK